jgi:hypothetical protein
VSEEGRSQDMGVKSFGALLATFSGLAPNTRYLGRVD